MRRARVACALQRRRREVEHGVGQASPALQRGGPVQVAHQRHGARGAAIRRSAPGRGQRQHAPARPHRIAAHAGRRRRSPRSTGWAAGGGQGRVQSTPGSGPGLRAQCRRVSFPESKTPAAMMSFTVTVQPSGRSFSVERDEPILYAAIRQGIGLPYGCKRRRLRLLQVPPARGPRDPRRAPGQGAVGRRRSRRLHADLLCRGADRL
jgi:hypothetical protein